MKAETSEASNASSKVAHKHGGHGSKDPSIFTALIAAVINLLLMFGLCCAYGMIMFNDQNAKHSGLGVKMNLGTAFLMGLIVAIFSKVPVAIGGPDLNPVVFIGAFVETLSASIERNLDMDSASEGYFCVNDHLEKYPDKCAQYHEEVAATTIFSVAFASALFSVTFVMLGSLRLTKVVSYVPASVMEAFLSCVGYKVFKYALKFCKYQPRQFIPACAVGVPLYFLKANHVGNPAIVMPVGILLPLCIFYIILVGAGLSVEDARKDKWMFDEIDNIPFYEIWTGSIGNASRINIGAWLETLPDLAVMFVVVILDCLLKISSTESKLPVSCDKNYEISLYGLGNILTALFGGSVGYMQLKFNVISYGVMGNVVDRRAGIFYALLSGAIFFSSSSVFNFFPRFFLSSLLFFAGAGFVAENLWGSRAVLANTEWFEILTILVVFIFSESLLYAVIAGILLTCMSFLYKYAKIPAIMGPPFPAGQTWTRLLRPEMLQLNIDHIVSNWALVVRLKGFVFFASTSSLIEDLYTIVNDQKTKQVAAYRRFKVIVLDCTLLDGMDAAAAKAMQKLCGNLKKEGIQTIWTSLGEDLLEQLKMRTVITDDSLVFPSLETAVLHVEHSATRYLDQIQKHWLGLHSAFQRHHSLAFDRLSTDPFEGLAIHDAARFGCPWQYCSRMTLTAEPRTVLWNFGETVRSLFYVHSGTVGLFDCAEVDLDKAEPVQVCGSGSFLNSEFLIRKPQRLYAVVLASGEAICWNENQWSSMSRKAPFMTSRIQRLAFDQEIFSAEAEQKSSNMINAGGSNLGIKETVNMPSDLLMEMQMLDSGEVLHDLGFFEPVGDDEQDFWLPVLPQMIRSDLCIAFNTFSESKLPTVGNINEEIPYLRSSLIREALIYSGVGDVVLKHEDREFITEDEFMELGQESFFAPLNKKTEQILRDMFVSSDTDNSGTLDIDELATLLRDRLKRDVNVETLDGIVLVWHEAVGEDGTASGKTMNYDTFLAVMSRYIRRCEPYWYVVRALESFTGKSLKGRTALSTSDFAGTELYENRREKLKEMFWAFDWMTNSDCQVDLAGVLAGLGFQIHLPAVPLMPVPKLSIRMSEVSKEASHHLHGRHLLDLRSEADFARPSIVVHPVLSLSDITMDLAAQSDIDAFFRSESVKSKVVVIENNFGWRKSLTDFVEDPLSSKLALFFAMGVSAAVLVSTIILVLEPIITEADGEVTDSERALWSTFEIVFTVIFGLELIFRFAVSEATRSNKMDFFLVPSNICDIIAILPLFVELVFSTYVQPVRMLRMARLLRLFRLARLTGKVSEFSTSVPPIIAVLTLIWAIYLKSKISY